jgi:glutamate carboxypeptidase
VLCHLDTVHPVGTLSALPWRIDGDRCYGPGLFDMKGGTFLALHAMKALQRAGAQTGLPVTFLLTSDEEIGSPSTRDLIESEAARHKYVLVPEPARRDGGVVTGRYAIARYQLTALGRPSHAGLRLGEGLSAIREVAHQIIAIEAMTSDESTFSVGVVSGGRWVNCVATTASIEILNMSKTEEALAEGHAKLRALEASHPELKLALESGVRRPLWTTAERDLALYEVARSVAAELGFDIPSQYSAGGSDGNFTGALGITTLDGLGPRGEGPHTLEEHVVISSLPERGRLLAGLLARLS